MQSGNNLHQRLMHRLRQLESAAISSLWRRTPLGTSTSSTRPTFECAQTAGGVEHPGRAAVHRPEQSTRQRGPEHIVALDTAKTVIVVNTQRWTGNELARPTGAALVTA